MLWVLRVIEELNVVPSKYLKKIVNTEDIWEVRVQQGNDIYRLLGFLHGIEFIVLTNGFTKKTQKTTAKEIKLAIKRKNKYLEGRENE